MAVLFFKRAFGMVPTLLGVIVISVLLIDLMPGDPAQMMVGDFATPEAVEAAREGLGLDRPTLVRVAEYVGGLFRGDLGESPLTGEPVGERIRSSLPITFSIALLAFVMSLALGLLGGTLAALRPRRFVDRLVLVLSSVVQAVPPFVLAILLIVPLAIDRNWFPATAYVPFTESPTQWLHHLLLPCFTLALGSAAEIARQTRGSLLDTLEQDYIRSMRARGLRERAIVVKHAAKNAATPVVTVLGLQVGRLFGGTVVIEMMFALPGFGYMALLAVTNRDLVLVQGVVVVGALFVLVTNLIVDTSYGFFNPRVRS